MPSPKLLDRVRERLRLRHYSLRTEDAYLHWINQMQIALRSGKRPMTHVGRQHRELRIEVCTLAAPTQQGMASKSVTRIVYARPFASAGICNVALEQQLPV